MQNRYIDIYMYQRVRQQDVVETSEPRGLRSTTDVLDNATSRRRSNIRQNGDDGHARPYDGTSGERGGRSGGLEADGVTNGRRGRMRCSDYPRSGKAADARR